MALVRRSMGSYQVVRALPGHGREVLLAKRPAEKGDNRYVLALFEVDAAQAGHLEHEVVRTMELDHPSITRAVELFEHDGKQVIVYEGVPGCTLGRLLEHLTQSGDKLSDGAAIQIGLVLFRALNAAHTATDAEGKTVPMVHAQLGLQQLFVSWTGEVRLLGMGLSTIFRLAAGLEPDVFVAQPFMAPEVRAGGALTVRANVFSAAAIMWTLLSGAMPTPDLALEPLSKLRPDLDKNVTGIIDKALETSLIKRIVSGPQIVRALDASGLASLAELRATVEELRALESFEGATIGAESFPPAALSDVPPGSLPPLPSLLPDSDQDRSSIPPDSSPASTDAPTLKRDVPAELLPKAKAAAPKPIAAPARTETKAGAEPKRWPGPARPKQKTEVGIAPVPPAEGSRRRLPPKLKPRLTKTFGTVTEGPDPLDVDVDFESKPPPAKSDVPTPEDPPPKKVEPPKVEPPKVDAVVKPVAATPLASAGDAAQAVSVSKPKGRPAEPLKHEPKVDTRNVDARTADAAPRDEAARPREPASPPPPPPPPVQRARPAQPPGIDVSAFTSHGPVERSRPSRAKWIMVALLGMAATFGVGLLVGRISVDAPASTAEPITSAPPTSHTPDPAPEPVPDAYADPSESVDAAETTAPDDSAAPESATTPDPSAAPSADIPDGYAVLRVDSAAADAYVYVGNEPIGPVGADNQVRCGAMFIRLGTHPLTRWLGPGRSINVPCQTSTTITMSAVGPAPKSSLPWPRPKPKPKPAGKGWTPDDL